MPTLPAPVATYSDDLYHFGWPETGLECILERFNENKDDIRAEFTVNLDDPLMGGCLYSGKLLLMGPNSRRDVKNILNERVDTIDWGGVLEKVCQMARERFRKGEPTVDLMGVDFSARPRFLLEPVIVPAGIVLRYGDGKTAKSLHTLYDCVRLAQNGVRTLYLDWEDDAETHAERLHALCCGMGVDVNADMIFYQRRSAKLADAARDIRSQIASKGIGHVVVDSLGMAAGGTNSEETIMPAMTAMRSLGVAVTAIHHLPKDSKDKTKPLGSVYSSNEARLTWLYEAETDAEEKLTLLMTNHAFNRGGKRPKMAYRLTFVNDGDALLSVEVEDLRLADVFAAGLFGSDMTPRNQVWTALDGSEKNLRELVQITGLTERQVEFALKKGPFESRVPFHEGPGRPALVWRRREDDRVSDSVFNSVENSR